jgi:cytochrome P450
VDGADWQRHRRITAPPFNERNSALVWVESLRQAHQMLESWTWNSDSGVKSVSTDIATLALHVMTCAGFGISYQFRDSLRGVKEGFSMSYGDALAAVMKNIVILVLVPSTVYSFPFLPKVLSDFKLAHDDFKKYMNEMITGAKARAAQGESGDPNLLNTLVQKSEEALAESGDKSSQSGLSDNEIFGNLFIFSFAGHETTANTLAYCVYLLAAFPEWQEWVGEEVDHVFRNHDGIETLDYEEIYPQLKRCLALMVSEQAHQHFYRGSS